MTRLPFHLTASVPVLRLRRLSSILAPTCFALTSACAPSEVASDAGHPPDASGEMARDAARAPEDAGLGDGGSGADTGPATAVLQNYTAGCRIEALNPTLPDEQGYFALEALTAAGPFTVGSVRYALVNDGAQCDATLAHEVLVFTYTGDAPPSRPSMESSLRVFAVDADPARSEDVLTLTASLATPITLRPGEHLGVAVRLSGDAAGNSLCLGMCTAGASAGTSFWSNASVEPYTWQDLVEGFRLGNLLIEAVAP
jgi:hypothetical protein